MKINLRRKILQTGVLYDNYNDSQFGYTGIDIVTGKVELYSDDNRRKSDRLYKITPKDKDFYWEFHHNGGYDRKEVKDLSVSSEEIIEFLKELHIKHASENDYNINGFDRIKNVAFYKGNYNEHLKANDMIYNILKNCIYIPGIDEFMECEDYMTPPTKFEIDEYKYLLSKVENYQLNISNHLHERRKYEEEISEARKMLSSNAMRKVEKYLSDPTSVQKIVQANEDALLFGLGQLKCTSITPEDYDRKIKLKVGFFEKILYQENTKATENIDLFIIPRDTYSFDLVPCGISLELIFNDLECREIKPSYKSVITRTYGPLLDFITDGKLRKARYNGGIEEYYKIMCDIIPDKKKAYNLLVEMDYNKYSEEEIYDILKEYAEAKIEKSDFSRESLYCFCKMCNALGIKRLEQQDNNFMEYIGNSFNLNYAIKMFDKLISIDTFCNNKLKFNYNIKKIYQVGSQIVEYAKENPECLEFQILKIFTEKYMKQQEIYYVGRNYSIGLMTKLSLSNSCSDETIVYSDSGTYTDKNGKIKTDISRIESKFCVLLPDDLKNAFIYNNIDKMIAAISKAFKAYEKNGKQKSIRK